jgi:hypothetical protein
VSTASTVAVNFCERVAEASPGVPVDCTSMGGSPDGFDEAHATMRNAADTKNEVRMDYPP